MIISYVFFLGFFFFFCIRIQINSMHCNWLSYLLSLLTYRLKGLTLHLFPSHFYTACNRKQVIYHVVLVIWVYWWPPSSLTRFSTFYISYKLVVNSRRMAQLRAHSSWEECFLDGAVYLHQSLWSQLPLKFIGGIHHFLRAYKLVTF